MTNIGLNKKSSGEFFNGSFYTPDNIKWFDFISEIWLPDPQKHLVFLPCAMGDKTRAKHGKKVFSESTTHQFMRAIRTEERFEKVVLSEPLTIVPYEYELHYLRPDYNLPAEDLSWQEEVTFILQLADILLKIRLHQPERQQIFYCGGTHHYFILKFANIKMHSKYGVEPFEIIAVVPEGGSRGYSRGAEQLRQMILDLEEGKSVVSREPDIETYLNSRGRYTNLATWHYIVTVQRVGRVVKDKVAVKKARINVSKPKHIRDGFSFFYKEKVEMKS